MGEKIVSVALAIVTGVTAVALLTNKSFGGNAKAIGGAFSGALHQIVVAGQGGNR